MTNILKKLRLFKSDESGASMVEYGVALLVVTAIGVGAMSTLGASTGEKVCAAVDVLGGVDAAC
jgi:pilus assembly protein Flp/PilA